MEGRALQQCSQCTRMTHFQAKSRACVHMYERVYLCVGNACVRTAYIFFCVSWNACFSVAHAKLGLLCVCMHPGIVPCRSTWMPTTFRWNQREPCMGSHALSFPYSLRGPGSPPPTWPGSRPPTSMLAGGASSTSFHRSTDGSPVAWVTLEIRRRYSSTCACCVCLRRLPAWLHTMHASL